MTAIRDNSQASRLFRGGRALGSTEDLGGLGLGGARPASASHIGGTYDDSRGAASSHPTAQAQQYDEGNAGGSGGGCSESRFDFPEQPVAAAVQHKNARPFRLVPQRQLRPEPSDEDESCSGSDSSNASSDMELGTAMASGMAMPEKRRARYRGTGDFAVLDKNSFTAATLAGGRCSGP